MGRHTIATLTSRKTINLRSGSGYTAQSLALVTAGLRYIFCNTHGSDSSGNHILKASSKGYSVESAKIHTGHANGGTYCNKNDCFYTTSYGGGSANKVIKCWTRKYKLRFTVTLPVYATGIAYDPITTDFYVSVGDYFYVFPYEAFAKGGKYKGKYNKFVKRFKDYQNQDIGGFNGVVMCCKSWDIHHSSNAYYTSYIDCYRARDGYYYGSYKTQGECESVAVDAGGNIHVLYAGHGGRRLILMNQNIYKGITSIRKTAVEKGVSNISSVKTVSETELRNRIVMQAKAYSGQNGKHFWDTYGRTADWCGMFVWTIFKECDMSDIVMPKSKNPAYVPNWHTWLDKNATRVSLKNAKPGDIVIYNSDSHIEIVGTKYNSKVGLQSIGGNTGSQDFRSSRVSSIRVHGGSPVIWSPKYSKTKASGVVVAETVTEMSLQMHPEQLYSSDNFAYLNSTNDKASKEAQNEQLAKLYKSITTGPVLADTSANLTTILAGIDLTGAKRPPTKVDGAAHGPALPVALNPVEAPFVEITIGGYTFGLKSAGENAPNYIDGLNVVRTNGSMNEYRINLIHQVSPGRNPNFIDELLAKNSYEKIQIKYGDANSNVIFVDSSALLIGADVNFDFTNYTISYTIKATSSVISTAIHRQSFPATTDKPSNIISELLNNSTTGLADVFTDMKDKNFIDSHNLIPRNDAVVEIEEVENINSLNYLKLLVSSMNSTTSNTSTYYLVLYDTYFQIYELDSANVGYDALLYEVTLNYPDDSQVFSFSCDTDFAWTLAQDFNGNLTDYNYGIDNIGNLNIYNNSGRPVVVDFASKQQTAISNNWWKNATEFPAKATLECRGLLSPLLLMTYIRINCLCYGQERLTSGVYIVTGQEDTLSGNGYRTRLSLLRLSGTQQHMTIDGRIRT